MNEANYKVRVARDLEDLIPVFMSNRRKELETLRVALAAADFEQLRQLRQVARRAAGAPSGDEAQDLRPGAGHVRGA